jgi:fibronectin-binding autotransporter adhesin
VDALFNTNSLAGFVLDPASGVAIDTNAASFDQTIALTAARSLTKLAANTLTLSAANTYSGATIVNNGTLSLTGSLDGGGAISTIGTSVFSQTSTGVISGASTFTQGSTGTSILAGTNTYTGVTNVNLGQLTISNAAALGTTDGNTIVAAGGRLAMATAGLSVAEPLAITGTGTTATNGALNFGGGVTGMALTGPITLDGAARIQADGSTGSTLSGGISLGANELTINTDGGATQTINTTAITGTGGSLVKSGGGTLVLAVANSYTGATTVNRHPVDHRQ